MRSPHRRTRNSRSSYQTTISGWVPLLISLTACSDSLNFVKSSGLVQDFDLAIVESAKELPKTARSAVHVGALAIGNEMADKLGADLEASGLNFTQSQAIVTKAKASVESAVGALVIPDQSANAFQTLLRLVADDPNDESFKLDPVYVASPAVIQGAMGALDEPAAGLGSSDERARVAQLSLSSGFTSLNGRIGGLKKTGAEALAKEIVSRAVVSLDDAGLGDSDAKAGAKAITTGAVSALGLAGFKADEVVGVAQSVVEGAVGELAIIAEKSAADNVDQLIFDAIEEVTQGAIEQVQTVSQAANDTSVDDIAGKLAASTLKGIKKLQSKITEVASSAAEGSSKKSLSFDVKSAIKKVSTRTIKVMNTVAKANNRDLSSSVSSVTKELVSGLDDAGFSKEDISSGAGAIASGTMSGIFAAGISIEEVNATGLVTKVMQGTVENLSSANLSETEIADIMPGIVGDTVSEFDEVGVTSKDDHKAFLSDVISGTMNSFEKAGVKNLAVVQSAVKGISKRATESLHHAGVKSEDFAEISGAIASTSVKLIANIKIDNLDDGKSGFKSIASEVTEGLMAGMGALQEQGFIDQALVSAGTAAAIDQAVEGLSFVQSNFQDLGIVGADFADISNEFTDGAFQGLAAGGVDSSYFAGIQSTVSSQLAEDFAAAGLTSAEIASFNDEFNQSITTATNLAAAVSQGVDGFEKCKDLFQDKSDQERRDIIDSKPVPFMCIKKSDKHCPPLADFEDMTYDWFNNGIPLEGYKVCESMRIPKVLTASGGFQVTSVARDFDDNFKAEFDWNPSAGAVEYEAIVSKELNCLNYDARKVVSSTTVRFPGLNPGSYYLCLTALNEFDLENPMDGGPIFFTVHQGTYANQPPPDSIPSGVTILLNAGASATTLNPIGVDITAIGAAEMFLSSDPNCGVGIWQPFLHSSTYQLPEVDGIHWVYVKLRNHHGESACIGDSISYSTGASHSGPPTTPSILIDGGATSTSNSSVSLSLSATGATEMFLSGGPTCTSGFWEPLQLTVSSYPISATSGPQWIYVKFRNANGETSCIGDSINYTGGSGESISIESSLTYVNYLSVSVSLTSPTATQMYITQVDSTCSTGGVWQTFDTFKSGYTLLNTNAVNHFYVKFKDSSNNESICYSDSIYHDDTPPSTPSIPSHPAATLVADEIDSISWAGSTDPSPGIVDYYEYAVGTTSGGTEHQPWTFLSSTMAPTKAFLSSDLLPGVNYYVSLRAVDGAGNISASISGSTMTYHPTWEFTTYFKAQFNDANTHFGTSVDLDGGKLIVGSKKGKFGTANPSGSVYVFEDTGSFWTQQDVLRPTNDGAEFDYFGWDAAIDGGTIAVGAKQEGSGHATITNSGSFTGDEVSANSGAVYVYEISGATWNQTAVLKAGNNTPQDFFGQSVVIDNDTIVVSAHLEDNDQTTITNGSTTPANNNSSDVGAVYVYKKNGSNDWVQEAFIKPSNNHNTMSFGYDIALYGNTLVVGASQDQANTNAIINGTTASGPSGYTNSGAVFVYTRTGSTWTQQAYIKASNVEIGDFFGNAVAVSHQVTPDEMRIAVGAFQEDSSQTTITTGAAPDGAATDAGAVYVYKRNGPTGPWTMEAYIKPSNLDATDHFGGFLDMDKNRLVVSSYQEDSGSTAIINAASATNPGPGHDETAADSGAAYVFRRDGTTWTQEAYLKAPNTGAGDKFGYSVAIDDNKIAVGAVEEDTSFTGVTISPPNNESKANSGAVYLFELKDD